MGTYQTVSTIQGRQDGIRTSGPNDSRARIFRCNWW
jgi:hypothetical protein